MKTQEEIQTAIDKIRSDERMYYPVARIDINAPLALVQLANESQLNALEWVLGLPKSKFPLIK